MSNDKDLGDMDEIERAERRLAEKARALKKQASGFAVLHGDDMDGALAACFHALRVIQEDEGSEEAWSLAYDTIEGVLALMLAIGHTCATAARDARERAALIDGSAYKPSTN